MSVSSLNDLRQRLRDAGLRATGSRLAVLRVLLSAESPLSHNDVAEQLVSESWDRATLYRNLLDLVRVDLARRTDVGDHVWRFELTHAKHDRTEHPHFVCTDCGSVECLPASAVAVRASGKIPAALRTKDIEVQVRGRCDQCQQHSKPGRSPR